MIEVEQLTKVYGSFSAIENVSFRVEPGEIMGFLGPNGAGKTTSMRILTGFLPATSGTARVAGYEVHENSMAVRERIGYLPETPPLYPEMTVENYLGFVAELKRVPAGDRAKQVDRAIERCNLQEKRNTLIRKLSKGFKQRVGIAQALVHDPPVIILDEPTVGLDPKQIIEVRSLIKSLAGNHTIVLSTHILPEVSMTCDRVVIINRGKVVATGTPSELSQQAARSTQLTLELEGSPEEIQTVVAEAGGQVVQMQGAAQPGRFQVTVAHAQGGDGWIRDLASRLIQAGLGVYEMRRSQVSLEDVFLQLTTQEEANSQEGGDE
ncbi:MAG: ABC transporter ATP-binding protein [Thermostichales cyanobacterium BF4_bins_65]